MGNCSGKAKEPQATRAEVAALEGALVKAAESTAIPLERLDDREELLRHFVQSIGAPPAAVTAIVEFSSGRDMNSWFNEYSRKRKPRIENMLRPYFMHPGKYKYRTTMVFTATKLRVNQNLKWGCCGADDRGTVGCTWKKDMSEEEQALVKSSDLVVV